MLTDEDGHCIYAVSLPFGTNTDQLTWIGVNTVPYGLKQRLDSINTVAVFVRKHEPFPVFFFHVLV